MKTHQVLIVGAGPTGMMLGAELQIAGVDVAIIERRRTPELSGARAGGRGLHARTLEVFDMRGIVDRFLAEGQKAQTTGFNGMQLDISDFPSRHPYGLALLQKHTERIMAAWVEELGVKIYRGYEVAGFVEEADRVVVDAHSHSHSHSPFHANYLVGCDGGRSIVRKNAGIDFPGWDASMSWLIAEAKMSEKPQFGFKEDAVGTHAMGPIDDRIGIVLTEPDIRATSERSLDDLKAALVRVYGTDFGVHDPNFISSFTDAARQAAIYRKGRILLAGDAAHIHPPLGGFGLNLGVQDAVNLGWKLAEVIKGISPDTLLDTYQTERRPVAARVIENTKAHVAVRRVDDRSKALSAFVGEWLKTDEVRKRFAGEMSGLAIHYDLGGDHPLVGWRMPDLEITTDKGRVRIFELLRNAHWVQIHFQGGIPSDEERGLHVLNATYDGPWELPVIGTIPAPTTVLIRPDGYVASAS